MSAEVLREAAALMRKRAAAIPAEGLTDWWFATDASDLMHLREHDREQIATFGHPAVALAVARWLDATADQYAAWSKSLRGVATVTPPTFTRPLAVARAYLAADA